MSTDARPSDAMAAYQQHLRALAARDLDAISAGYAEDAVLVDTDRIGRGREHIRTVFAEQLDAAAALEPTVEVYAEADVVFVSWRATPADGPALVGADTFVVRDGLITVHTGFVHAIPAR